MSNQQNRELAHGTIGNQINIESNQKSKNTEVTEEIRDRDLVIETNSRYRNSSIYNMKTWRRNDDW